MMTSKDMLVVGVECSDVSQLAHDENLRLPKDFEAGQFMFEHHEDIIARMINAACKGIVDNLKLHFEDEDTD